MLWLNRFGMVVFNIILSPVKHSNVWGPNPREWSDLVGHYKVYAIRPSGKWTFSQETSPRRDHFLLFDLCYCQGGSARKEKLSELSSCPSGSSYVCLEVDREPLLHSQQTRKRIWPWRYALVWLKGGFYGVDMDSPPPPGSLQALEVDGGDNYDSRVSLATNDTKCDHRYVDRRSVITNLRVRSKLTKTKVYAELPSKPETSMGYFENLSLRTTLRIEREIMFSEDHRSTIMHLNLTSRTLAVTCSGLLWCLGTSCVSFS